MTMCRCFAMNRDDDDDDDDDVIVVVITSLCCLSTHVQESHVVLLKIISERTATGSLETFSSVILPQIKLAKAKLEASPSSSSRSNHAANFGRQRLRGECVALGV